MACAKSPARRSGISSRAWRRSSCLAAGKRLRDGEKPRDHALDIAVHRGRRRIECNRGDGGGGVVADAGKRAQRRLARGKFSAVLLDHGARASMQVARPGIVAEPRPGLEHLFERR